MTIALLCTAALLGTLLARRLQRARRLARSSAPIQCVRRGGIDVYI